MSFTKIGIIWIDDNKGSGVGMRHVDSGYECTSSDPSKVRKIRLNDLKPNHIYITNIKPNNYKRFGLDRYKNINSSKFLGVTLSTIAIELGLSDKLSEKLPIFYTVCQLLATKLEEQFGINLMRTEFTATREIHAKLLPDNQRERPLLSMAPSLELERAITNSMQKMQANTLRKSRDIQSITSARFPRVPYTLTMLNLLYPASNEYTMNQNFNGYMIGQSEKSNICGDTDVLNELTELAKTHCGFIEVEQISSISKYSDYWPFGKELQSTPPRRWAAIPEAIDLANYSMIKLGTLYMTEGKKLPFAPTMPEPNEVRFLSYINGLVNEIVWTSIAYSQANDRYPSPVSTYIRAYDRIMLRLKAKTFVDNQIEVSSFNTGSIRFYIDPTDKAETQKLKELILSENMIPQIDLL
ncbi:hypothetical protein ACTFQF_00890 [Aliivibrio fischeri]|uniref:Uncharacterized protein n=1 Tax=Aliivibrio fischeri (strain MJ11) TaxID=388396 RepID=B5EW67_ALIFM|nr:hypothetical protein [Aliivibrio fischeri]ACH64687.1 hypothetical protein VFMJ11_B0124 [Aliivibrio fischeri MJ11]MUK37607.1 hypothetical protein [Aliivibrio fischeri]